MAHNEKFDSIVNRRIVNFAESGDTTPPVDMSGVLFVSGGALWYLGFDSTYTEVAVK